MINKQNSESKRLASLKKFKETHKAKERLIQEALKSTESSTLKNNKIIFSDDIDQVENVQIEAKETDNKVVKNLSLFDDGDDDDDDDEDNFDFSVSKKTKTRVIGNDSRFTLDDRFVEEDGKNEEDEDDFNEKGTPEGVDDLEEEKKKQLEILETVLGKPILKRDEKEQSNQRKKKMVRYDPTEAAHNQHEIIEEKAPPKKKKKKNTEVAKKDDPPAPVSNEIFFSVSDALTENLKQHEEFSLLKTFNPKDDGIDEPEEKSNQETPNFNFNFDPQNCFKYDDSDNEREKEEKNEHFDEKKSYESTLIERNKTFFFIENDPRFKEAQEFIKTNTKSSESFKVIRTELKQIVRNKRRNNLRNNKVPKKMNIKKKKFK